MQNGRTTSVTIGDIYMMKKEEDVVKPTIPKFYRRFVDNIYKWRNKDQDDQLYYKVDNHNKSIKLWKYRNKSFKVCRYKNGYKRRWSL